MSYTIYLTADPDAPDDSDLGDSWNYTSNCGDMWRLAGADLAEYHDKRAGECLPSLKSSIADMKAVPEKYTALNPSNGWGSYKTLVPALERLVEIFESAPLAVVYVSR